jgi:ABC-type lipoprotein release transport system permease subunit
MAIPLSYNLRNIRQRPVSTLTTAIGIALTVTIFVGALALAAGFQSALVETGTEGNVIVLRKGADSEISSGIGRDASNIVRAHPAITTGPDGRPLVSSEMVVVTNRDRLGQPGSSNVTVRGIDPEAMALRSQVRITVGRMFAPGSDEVIIGARIAPRFVNCAVGDRIRFQQRDFTVVGHFDAGGSAFESEIWGDNSSLQPALQRGGGFQSVTFRLRDPSAFAELKKELESDPRLQVQVQREATWYTDQSGALASTIRVLGVFITIIMALGAVFGAMNTMYAAVQSRTREIATLLVLGFSPMAVLVSFMAESVLLSLLGGAIGCLLALPINGIVTSTTNFSSFSEVAFDIRVTQEALFAGMMFAAGKGVVGGFLPALKAARQSLSSSLRGA